MKTPKRDLVFLFDVDNTLLDNDWIQRDLYRHLARSYGPMSASATSRSSKSCAKKSATPTIWAHWSATG